MSLHICPLPLSSEWHSGRTPPQGPPLLARSAYLQLPFLSISEYLVPALVSPATTEGSKFNYHLTKLLLCECVSECVVSSSLFKSSSEESERERELTGQEQEEKEICFFAVSCQCKMHFLRAQLTDLLAISEISEISNCNRIFSLRSSTDAGDLDSLFRSLRIWRSHLRSLPPPATSRVTASSRSSTVHLRPCLQSAQSLSPRSNHFQLSPLFYPLLLSPLSLFLTTLTNLPRLLLLLLK